MFRTDTIYNQSVLKKAKGYPISKLIGKRYNFTVDAVMPELIDTDKDRKPGVYLGIEFVDNENKTEEASVILDVDSTRKLINLLNESLEDLDKKTECKNNLEEVINLMNENNDEKARIDIEYYSPYFVVDADSAVKVYKISLFTKSADLIETIIPMYLTGNLEIDYKNINTILKFNKSQIHYGPELLKIGQKYMEDKMKVLENEVNKKTGKSSK